jgi:ribosomal protein S18 acetylase RimI-like enzyme
MATKYPKSAKTGDSGVALVQKLTTDMGAVFRSFNNSDLGIDAAIELLNDAREPCGDIVLVQIKAGGSYIQNGKFYIKTDKDHFETWARYAVPVVGIVCDVKKGKARWVDISHHLRKKPDVIVNGPYSILAPSNQPFSPVGFHKFIKRFRRSTHPTTSVSATPNLLIRPWQLSDMKPTRALLNTIASDYPGFDNWLTKKLTTTGAAAPSKKVAVVNDQIAAFSMWQTKDERNIKLQTFIVGSLFRGTAIGQHLLYHELRTWAADPKIERVHVTIASNKSDLISYFRTFGFRVEGIAANRYPRKSAELIMTKYLIRDTIRTPISLKKFVQKLEDRFWGLSLSATRFGVKAEDLAMPAFLPQIYVITNSSESTVTPRIILEDNNKKQLSSYDDELLMREFYPFRIHLKNKRYVLVPIYSAWVDQMLSSSGDASSLKLRIDNVYYCYPKISNLAKGDLVIFYETQTGGGRKAAIGAALVQEVVIDTPSNLFKRFSNYGAYTLANIDKHKNARGNAKAIKFTLFEPFLKIVPLASINTHLGLKTTVQGLTPITRDGFEKIRTEGLTKP